VCFGVAAGEMLTVTLNPNTHQGFDNAWADVIPKNGFSSSADVGEVLAHPLIVYEDDPDVLALVNMMVST
jgi:hypothetical protein